MPMRTEADRVWNASTRESTLGERALLLGRRHVQFPGETIDMGRARECAEEPVGYSRRVADDKDLVTVEHLSRFGIDHRADDKGPNRGVLVVL
jgi:hypothetical protein